MGGKSKSTSSTVNPIATQQYNSAVAALGNSSYKPVTSEQISGYMSPYLSNVADTTISGLNKSRQMALNQGADAATAAKAFGGSRHGVADSLTNSEYDQNTATILANLYNQGYGQAAGMAQTENAAANQYPLAVQQLLGQLAGQTGSTTKATQTPPALDTAGKWLQAIGSTASTAAALSDRRLKRDVVPLGERMGRMWYSFRYLWSDEVHEGVMAQENPDIALAHPSGFLMVDYSKVGV